jgi:arginine:pyruvate transaminase
MCFPGTQTALFATLMGLTGPGDGVLVGDPFYATYEGVIRASGAHRQSVPLRAENGFRLTAEDLEAAITPQSRVLLMNSPQNPTGAVLSAGEIARIGAVCKAHDLWIVSDEVYEELVFDGRFASPFDDPALPSGPWPCHRSRSPMRHRGFAADGRSDRMNFVKNCCRCLKPCCSAISPSSPT